MRTTFPLITALVIISNTNRQVEGEVRTQDNLQVIWDVHPYQSFYQDNDERANMCVLCGITEVYTEGSGNNEYNNHFKHSLWICVTHNHAALNTTQYTDVVKTDIVFYI